jgi:hypothetical protein
MKNIKLKIQEAQDKVQRLLKINNMPEKQDPRGNAKNKNTWAMSGKIRFKLKLSKKSSIFATLKLKVKLEGKKMTPLILHPTDTSQWYSLIIEAEAQINVNLNIDTESYLVFLLMRSSKSTLWLDSSVGMDFMHAMQHSGQIQKTMLIDVGDKSLLVSGFFPELAQKKRLDPNYFIQIGQIAYASVGSLPDEPQHQLYQDLSQQFLTLKTILHQARQLFSS